MGYHRTVDFYIKINKKTKKLKHFSYKMFLEPKCIYVSSRSSHSNHIENVEENKKTKTFLFLVFVSGLWDKMNRTNKISSTQNKNYD